MKKMGLLEEEKVLKLKGKIVKEAGQNRLKWW